MATSKKKTTEFMTDALDRMFRAVGFDGFDQEFAKQDQWYLMREWTKDQEDEYRDWFINECRKRLKMTERQAVFEAGYFMLNWAWKTKNSDI